jgi:DNA modification methylase
MERFVNKVFCGDSIRLLSQMPSECIDCVLADSMYGVSKNPGKSFTYDWGVDPSYGDPVRYWEYHRPIYKECLRVLKPGGTLAWAMGWKFHDHFDEWFGGHRIWALSRIKWQGINAFDNIWLAQTKEQEPIRFPDDDAVVVLNTHPKLLKLHPCPKSVNEMRFMVKHLSQSGQIILDPFCGLGSTLLAAESLGRKWIGCDLSKRYCQVTMKRLADLKAKAQVETSVESQRKVHAFRSEAQKSSKPLFTQGNKKLGENVFIFNLPVIATCPGRSAACEAVCYADWGYFRYPKNRQRNMRNLEASKSPDFVDRAVAELRRRGAQLVRPHSSGDFYNAEYVSKWQQIAASMPDVTFWAYTRSWRIPAILEELKRLAQLPNFCLWFSADQDTGLPPNVENVRACWLQIGEEPPHDPVSRQLEVELIFPAKLRGRAKNKRIASALVCPTYNGTPAGEKTTCEKCAFCWTKSGSRPTLLQIGNLNHA